MRFTAAIVALAGAALAEEVSTLYSTEYYTITSCAAAVTNCPAHSTVVSSSVFPVVPTGTGVPPHYTNGTSTAVQPPYPTTHKGEPTGPVVLPTGGFTTVAPVCPGHSVKTISTSITTVIPTVIYETVEVPCPTGGPGGPGGPAPSGHTPSGSIPTVTKPTVPIVTGGASTMGGSIALAAAAGVLALLA